MKLLLDESVPRRLASSPEAFTLRTAQEMGWAGNGRLDTLQRRRPNVENSSALHIGMTGTPGSRDIEVEVRVQPGASRDRIGGFHDGTLRVYVGAPPERGKANAKLLRLLAKALGIARQRVLLIRGETSRTKRLRIIGMSEDEFQERMLRASGS